MIYQIYDVMMSIATWYIVHFWIYLFNHNTLNNQTWPVDIYKEGQQFSEIFWTNWSSGAKLQVLFLLETCSNYSITNYAKIPLFPFLEKVNKG